jgi:hypothetical protein
MLQASAHAVDFKVGRHFGFWRGTGLSLPWSKAFSVLDLLTSSAFVDTNPTGYEPRYVNRWP